MNSQKIYQLFFNDSYYGVESKKLVGVFSSKEKAVSHLDQILEKNKIQLSDDNLKQLKSYLITNNQVEVEHDFCFAFETIELDTIENYYY